MQPPNPSPYPEIPRRRHLEEHSIRASSIWRTSRAASADLVVSEIKGSAVSPVGNGEASAEAPMADREGQEALDPEAMADAAGDAAAVVILPAPLAADPADRAAAVVEAVAAGDVVAAGSSGWEGSAAETPIQSM